jgi:hypothetical protein
MRSTLTLTAIALIVGAMGLSAYGMMGELKEPSASFSVNYPESGQALVMKALNRKDCKCLGGYFINWFTTLNYAGGTDALNGFVADLARCPKSTVSVRFKKDAGNQDWTLLYSPLETNHFDVTINLNSKKLKLDDLRLPEIQSP